MRKRKLAATLLAGATFVLPAMMPAAYAEGEDYSGTGRFTTPFREDGAAYDAANNTFTGGGLPGPEDDRGDTGCTAADPATGMKDCLPAGASQSLLADGRILYWNAIEGSEDLDQPDEAIVPMGGDRARNDRSRVLTLDWAKLTGARWEEPVNPTGYFEGSPTEPPLLPITESNENSGDNFNSDGSLFCSDQKQLANGTILAAGGTNYYAEPRIDESHGVIELEGVRNSRIFDPAGGNGKGEWTRAADLNYGRWYPSMVTLDNGDIFIASGVTKLMKPIYPEKDPSRSGDNVPETETYHTNPQDPAYKTWTHNEDVEDSGSGDRSLPLFPRLHLLPNGNVYYDAAGQSYNPQGQSYKQATWNIAATYNPDTLKWKELGVPGLETALEAEPGFRGSTFSQALTYRPNGAGEYAKASFLTAGGVTLMSPGSYLPTDSTRINTVDVSGGAETLSTMAAGKLGRPRWYSSAVTLPTGEVLAFSGADVDEVVSPGMESPVRQAEMFTPTYDENTGELNGGEWKDVAIANRKRTYHNNAVLLPDGRVLIGGHAPIPRGYYQPANNPDVPGVREASNNFKDASFEIYEPPYLHNGVSRPEIEAGFRNPKVDYGELLHIPTPNTVDELDSVVLVRNPSATHLIDADQRVVELDIIGKNGNALQVQVPNNKAVLPPGPYMLFLNKDATPDNKEDHNSVPSIATQVFVDTPMPGWAANAQTYPTASTVVAPAPAPEGSDAPPADPTAAATSAASAVAAAAGSALPTSPVASTSNADRPRNLGMLALALGAVVAAGSLAGTRRRRAGVRITR